MTEQYYDLPIALGEILHKKEPSRISLQDSISKWIHLLAVTRFGECRHDESFGCQVWENDFENISNTQKFKDELSRLVTASIIKHEPRLNNIRVEIQVEQVELMAQNKRIKVRISMKVRGTLSATNEPFQHNEMFFVGPLSYS